MMMFFRAHKFLVIFLALILLAGFGAVLFHHHDDGVDHSDCAVCHFVKQITGSLIFASIIAGLLFSSKKFAVPASEKLGLFDFISHLKNRAPPVLA
ncbi:MAG: hypothetical protein HZC17_03420 [Candidatus Omnitrophica bacterium]|nr:hypothetical protein [Candidatus Omnitrophota bacterium]